MLRRSTNPRTRRLRHAMAVAALLLVAGCRSKVTEFRIVDYGAAGSPRRFFQTFEECYYRELANANAEIVARSVTTGEDDAPTTQVVHVRTFWVPQPGRTHAETTMINAIVSYHILTGPDGASFEGSGFVTCRESYGRNRMTGRLELSSLSPQRRLGEAQRLFERAELSGRFIAERDPARVVAIINEMKRLFGPRPDYVPDASAPEY